MTATLRPARSTDAGKIGEILHGFSRENNWMPDLHSCAETIAWCGRMIDLNWVIIAESGEGVIGFLALDGTEVQSLYVAAGARRKGVGRQLLDHAKEKQGQLSLYAFQDNVPAQRFYERNGFAEIARSDGSGNDEGLPDIRYAWKQAEKQDG